MNSTPVQGRSGSGHFSGNWDAKSEEILVKKPLLHRRGVQQFMIACFSAFGLLAVLAILRIDSRLSDRAVDFAHNQRSVAAFCRSDEFSAFARSLDAQFLATLNFVVARPAAAGALLPEISAWEKSHHEVPWALQLQVLPISAEPTRIFSAGRDACALLASRGFVFDEARRLEGRRLFVHLLEPYEAAYFRRMPENMFSGLNTDGPLRDQILGAYADHVSAAATNGDVERLAVLYTKFGPGMWSEIDRLSGKPAAVASDKP